VPDHCGIDASISRGLGGRERVLDANPLRQNATPWRSATAPYRGT
jgi:hypothetical protein